MSDFELSPQERVDILEKRLKNLEFIYAKDQSGNTLNAIRGTESALHDAREDLRTQKAAN